MMRSRYIFTSVLLVFAVITSVLLYSYFKKINLPDAGIPAFGSENIPAEVVEIIEDGEIDLGGIVQRYQIVRVILQEGKYEGIMMEMDYGKRQVLSNAIYLQPGDQVLVTVGARPDGVLTAYFVRGGPVNS